MDSRTSGDDVLSNELELLDSMFSSTCASLESNTFDDEKGCVKIVTKKPRFIFHINLRARSE